MSRRRTNFVGILASGLLLLGCNEPRGGTAANSNTLPLEDSHIAEYPPLEVHAMSFNIRYDNPNDGLSAWPNRRSRVADLIKNHQPDVIGIQEALEHQITYLDSVLVNYIFVGVGRDDGALSGEFSPLLVDTTKWYVSAWDTKWLSSFPDSIGSVGWDAALPRIATRATLEHLESGRSLFAINTHFDHWGEEARTNSASLIRNWAVDAEHLAVLVTGDFNFTPTASGYEQLVGSDDLSKGLTDVAESDTSSTFRGFVQSDAVFGGRIDYIFSSGQTSFGGYSTIEDLKEGRFVSDHLPVSATIMY